MATSAWLTQYQSLRSSSESLIVAIEDVCDLWPTVKDAFEAHNQLKKTILNNKAHNTVMIEKLPVEYILTTDHRLRTRFPLEQSPFLFRLPYATVVLVSCEDLDDYKSILKPRIRAMVQNDEREWFIVFVSKNNATDSSGKQAKRVYSKIEVDFNTKRRERCCRLDSTVIDAVTWDEIETRMCECIRNTLDRRIQFYDDEIRRLSEIRFTPTWSFCNFFIVKESLAFMFELSHLYEDALREYDELEQVYLEIVNTPTSKQKDFGGMDDGDDRAALLEVSRKPFSQYAVDDCFKEFDFRQYLFARQASLLFSLNLSVDVCGRGIAFIYSFSKSLSLRERDLPFCLRDLWIITACLSLIRATQGRIPSRAANPDAEKEFYRLQADLNSLARTKLMRLADLTGYGFLLERSPCNSALLSMTPWPKPLVWPSVPSDAAARILAKEQLVQEKTSPPEIAKHQLTISPTMLLREANRRRASLSAGNLSEIMESRLSLKDGPAAENAAGSASPVNRSVSGNGRPVSPGLSLSPSRGFDRPMKLAEVHAAAEYAILTLATDETLREAISSVEGFQDLYMQLTRAAADNYHRSRKRHGVVLDGEMAAVYFRAGNFDSASKLYEKVCALYSMERWYGLLAEVLPRLSECQKQLGDIAGYVSSCIKLLALDRGLLVHQERCSLQCEVVKLAHSGMATSVSVDVSPLVTFSSQGGSPLSLCEGDPGTLSVTIWSGFPEDLVLESMSLALNAINGDEGVKAIKSVESPLLKPGKNSIAMLVQPQRPGSYVLGAFTGQIGQLKLRSHTYCTTSALSSKGGSPESDDYLSAERPLRPVIVVQDSRPLVEIKTVVSGGLLIGERQWIGLVVRPIDYQLKGAALHISTSPPALSLCQPHLCQLQPYNRVGWTVDDHSLPAAKAFERISEGKVEIPEWASEIVSVVWVQVEAKRHDEENSDGARRSIRVKLEFGINRSRIFDKTIGIAFTEPFRIDTHLVSRGNKGEFVLQVVLISQVNAATTIVDARLELQDGFCDENGGKPRPLWLFPIAMAANAKCALLFHINSSSTTSSECTCLKLGYKISGSRSIGAHYPPKKEEEKEEEEEEERELKYNCKFKLQIPVVDKVVAVGMLPLPSLPPLVGEQLHFQWQVERLKQSSASSGNVVDEEKIGYEIEASSDNWMIAGRKKGRIGLRLVIGSKVVISMGCVPLVAGHVRPPRLRLLSVNKVNVSHSPPSPHLLCIFPAPPPSSFCIATK